MSDGSGPDALLGREPAHALGLIHNAIHAIERDDWERARRTVQQALALLPRDDPAARLLREGCCGEETHPRDPQFRDAVCRAEDELAARQDHEIVTDGGNVEPADGLQFVDVDGNVRDRANIVGESESKDRDTPVTVVDSLVLLEWGRLVRMRHGSRTNVEICLREPEEDSEMNRAALVARHPDRDTVLAAAPVKDDGGETTLPASDETVRHHYQPGKLPTGRAEVVSQETFTRETSDPQEQVRITVTDSDEHGLERWTEVQETDSWRVVGVEPISEWTRETTAQVVRGDSA